LLQDTQVDLSGAEPAYHFRTAQRVLTRAGAERVAHFVAEFDPAYQGLEVHFIRLCNSQGGVSPKYHCFGEFSFDERNLGDLGLRI
jgi:hypothetical protein